MKARSIIVGVNVNYRREIDGLRAIAVLSVIFFHSGVTVFSGGYIGVDVFFVISGYLISKIIISEKINHRFSILNFYEKRARRILPALFLMIFFSSMAALVMLPPKELRSFASNIVGVMLFISNLVINSELGYFDTAAELKPLLHTWSLAVEEQYYLFFPALVALVWRLNRWLVVGVMILVGALSLFYAHSMAIKTPGEGFFLLTTRYWELMLGVIAALADIRGIKINSERWMNSVLAGSGLLMIAVPIFIYNQQTPFPSAFSLMPTVGALMVIMFASERNLTGKLLSLPGLTKIGLISYSAYLWHQPVFVFARYADIDMGEVANVLFIIAIVLIVSYFSWRFVEAPFRNKNLISKRVLSWFSLLGVALFILFGYAGYKTHGFASLRVNASQRAVLETAVPSPKRKECHTSGANYLPPKNACEYFVGPTNFAVFGDSHAVELSYALAEEIKPLGASLKQLSFSSCVPTYLREQSEGKNFCSRWTKEAIEFLIAQRSIDVVVIAYRLNAVFTGEHERIYPKIPDEVSERDRVNRWSDLLLIIKELQKHHKQVFLILQAPELPRSAESLLFEAADPKGKIKGVTKDWWDKRSQFVQQKLSELPPGVRVIDPANFFCDQASCYASKGGVAYYFDDDHMSIDGARVVARQIVAGLPRESSKRKPD